MLPCSNVAGRETVQVCVLRTSRKLGCLFGEGLAPSGRGIGANGSDFLCFPEGRAHLWAATTPQGRLRSAKPHRFGERALCGGGIGCRAMRSVPLRRIFLRRRLEARWLYPTLDRFAALRSPCVLHGVEGQTHRSPREHPNLSPTIVRGEQRTWL
jgi:hypothetical protein